MFDLEDLVRRCCAVADAPDPAGAALAVLQDALVHRSAIDDRLRAERAELVLLHRGPEVVITKVVWAPAMRFPPHDHLTWACIGLYRGREHNRFFRSSADGTLTEVGELVLDAGEAGILGPDVIHSVTNPSTTGYTGAIHVYGGDFLSLPRSNWVGDPPVRRPADVEQTQAVFAAANAAAGRDGPPSTSEGGSS